MKHSWHFNKKKSKLTDNNNNEREDVGDISFADVLQNRCSQNFRKIHRKTPMLELHPGGLQLSCFPVDFAKFLGTFIL